MDSRQRCKIIHDEISYSGPLPWVHFGEVNNGLLGYKVKHLEKQSHDHLKFVANISQQSTHIACVSVELKN